MSSSLGQLGVGAAGGLIGFLLGGVPGALIGFSLGFTAGGKLFPPNQPGKPKQNDEFDITTATEGTPVAIVFGEREIHGNIIFVDRERLHIEEIQQSGGKGGGGGDQIIETRTFAPIHYGLCAGTLDELIYVRDGKGQDWEALNTDYGGAPLQISTGAGTDFLYKPPDGTPPMPGVTSIYCADMYLCSNARSVTPLRFKVRVLPVAPLGDPRSGLTTGVNPASIYWHILTDKQFFIGLDPALLNQDSFQDAYDRFKAEDMGLNYLLEGRVSSGEEIFNELDAHVNAILRCGLDGRLELYPIRHDNYTPFVIQEREIADIKSNIKTWLFVETDFVATYPDALADYSQRTVPYNNEAVSETTGRRKLETYDFPQFTDKRNVMRRLSQLAEEKSFPNPPFSLLVSKKFHKTRVADVAYVTHSDFGDTPLKIRFWSIDDADLGKEGMRLKGTLVRDPVDANYIPPAPGTNQTTISPAPVAPIQIGGLGNAWQYHHGPPTVPPDPPLPPVGGSTPTQGSPAALSPVYCVEDEGYFGRPCFLFAVKGKGSDVVCAIESRHAKEAELPVNLVAKTVQSRWAFAFRVLEVIKAGDWTYAATKKLRVQFYPSFPGQTFAVPNQDDVDDNGFLRQMETSRWCLLVGNTELWGWKACTPVGGDVYEFEGCVRALNKEYLWGWPVGTPILVVDVRGLSRQAGLTYEAWAHRQRFIARADYDDVGLVARVRSWFQSINYLGQQQGPSSGFGGSAGRTWKVRENSNVNLSSNFYPPRNEIRADRAPMPPCIAVRVGTTQTYMSWYALAALMGSVGDWLIEFSPFPDDVSGIGDRVVYDTVPTVGYLSGPPDEPYDGAPEIPTDKAFNDWVGPTSPVNGQTYRLFIMATNANPLTGTPLRTIDITFDGTETAWPAFEYSLTDQTTDGVNNAPNSLWFWVAVQGRADEFCRPRLVDKLGGFAPQSHPELALIPGPPA